jgi:selenocysteine-specific elongation factor
MIVIGTAGHIDHGKSSIVKRLTGTDPDRLPEEKSRGMTIDLGFAFYHGASGDTIALVDVPGHERFVRNMIAGAGGIDAVMLVIAADDGWMPQSEEHFQITRLLGVRRGLIVINKIDMVEPDWLELLEQDIKKRTDGSFLSDAPIVRVSAQTGVGFDTLAAHLDSLSRELESRQDIGKARLFIDRSFVRHGMGGVVTGTLRGGTLSVGQSVAVWPGQAVAKVRTLQSNNQDVTTAVPGQRTAVSFTGVERADLIRGGVVSGRTDLEYFRQHSVLALSLELLSSAAVVLKGRRRALLIVGTTEAEGEVRPAEARELGPGHRGVVFFKPDQPVYSLVGDHYILRLPTPMVTLGGGSVIDHLEHFPRQKQLADQAYLNDRVDPGLNALITSELCKCLMVKQDVLLENSDFAAHEIREHLRSLADSGQIGSRGNWVYARAAMTDAIADIAATMNALLGEQSHVRGLDAATMVSRVFKSHWPPDALLEHLVSEGAIVKAGDLYTVPGRGTVLKGIIKQAYEEIMSTLRAHPYDPPKLAELADRGKQYQQAIKYALESADVYKCGSEFLFAIDTWRSILCFVREHLNANGEFRVSDLRDKFGLTRKYAIPILEDTDRIGLTSRQGDIRVKGRRFEENSLL